LRKACWFNRKRKASLEQTFENIANTRVKILTTWAENQWSFLHDASLYLSTKSPHEYRDTLNRLLNRSADLSELFIVSAQGEILESTYPSQKNKKVVSTQALNEGLVQPFLHGPYRDPVTLAIGPSSSHFHDEVTLMFYQPIELAGDTRGCLCGRIANDVIGDLIQREAGHIYSESGYNYLFMVNSHFDPSIKQGVALSRSRFEDNHFPMVRI
jgi:hypothetical protein